MSTVKLSVIGLYNYDNTLFDGLTIPDGMDKPALIDLILTECSDFNVVYPDPVFFKARLATWNTRRLPIWTKLYATTQFEYDPIYNYDRYEEHSETVTHTGTDATSSSGTASSTASSTASGTSTDTESRTAYNSSTLAVTSQVQGETSATDSNTASTNSTNSGTRTLNLEDTVTRRIRAYGNIGVTTSQQMLESERQVDMYDIYAIIVSDFMESFCIQVY